MHNLYPVSLEVSDIQGRIKPSQDRAGPLVETANDWNDVHHLPLDWNLLVNVSYNDTEFILQYMGSLKKRCQFLLFYYNNLGPFSSK